MASDLKYLQEDLQLKKANVYRSIPYSRFGSNRDAHCYRKAYPHLVAFKVSVMCVVVKFEEIYLDKRLIQID